MYQSYETNFCCENQFYESMDYIDYPITYDQPIQQKKSNQRRSKHVPHRLRPAHLVEQRNTRERRRVHDVNQAFQILQTLLPFDESDQTPTSRISKVRTLRTAVFYIDALQRMLHQN